MLNYKVLWCHVCLPVLLWALVTCIVTCLIPKLCDLSNYARKRQSEANNASWLNGTKWEALAPCRRVRQVERCRYKLVTVKYDTAHSVIRTAFYYKSRSRERAKKICLTIIITLSALCLICGVLSLYVFRVSQYLIFTSYLHFHNILSSLSQHLILTFKLYYWSLEYTSSFYVTCVI